MEENGMDETWGTFGGEGTFAQDFDGKTWVKEATWKT